jgi:minor extracellular serine protease Vpr
MLTRPRAESRQTGLLALVSALLTVLLVAAGGQDSTRAAASAPAVNWQGLVGSGVHPRVALGQRLLVILKTPSLADRVAAAGGRATDKQERAWTAAALSEQRLLVSRLAVQGVRVQPEYSFARVLSGFSAALDARAVALLERDNAVQGIYPVRVAYPSAVSSTLLDNRAFTDALGRMPGLALPGFDGRGVTVALLDTGVDRSHPFLRGNFTDGIDVLDPNGDATAGANPDSPAELERHATELAGIVVGATGPRSVRGVAPGARLLPIRVAGWQPDAGGRYGVFGRTDQLIAGIERAVDPNADGNAHDAARIALVGLSAPFAGFPDDPAARAVAGALRLDTLVVVPAGNDGAAGPSFGSISGPGGSVAALTVGAADTRDDVEEARVTLRSGLDIVLDQVLPLVGAAEPREAVNVAVAAPELTRKRSSFTSLASLFSPGGLSLVAGRAAVLPAGEAPALVAGNAARAGAAAVLLYGARLPAGGIGLDEETPVPVVAIPTAAAVRLLNAISRGADVGASIGAARTARNAEVATVAPFSSTGLAYDGRVKPDLVAPGIAIGTSDVGVAGDGSPRYASVNGSSAAAAAVAGAAALLAQARPSLDAAALHSVLAGNARPLPGESVTTEGAGYVSLGASAAAELAAEPSTLALGNARDARWTRVRKVVVRNISTRTVRGGVRIERDAEGAASVRFAASPARFELEAGQSLEIKLTVRVASPPQGRAPAEGSLRIAVDGGTPVRVPWVVTFGSTANTLLGPLHLSQREFTPSDAAPALLTFQAGRILGTGGRAQVQPVASLELRLLRSNGTDLGSLARLRDLLPGRYAFGLTGRTPAGNVLGRGNYFIRVIATPSLPGPASVKQVLFRVK